VREQAHEEARAPREHEAAERDRGGEGDRAGYGTLASLTAALIAGTTSCRSPITA
jgi:hypothetical protein